MDDDADKPKMFRTLRGFLNGEEPDEANYFRFSATLRIHGVGVPFCENISFSRERYNAPQAMAFITLWFPRRADGSTRGMRPPSPRFGFFLRSPFCIVYLS